MIGWFDCSSGVSGDMLLGALVDVGVPVDVMQDAVAAVAPEPVRLHAAEVSRAGLRACRVRVDAAESSTRRTWVEIRDLLDHGALEPSVRAIAVRAFTRLAEAEARVHGTTPERVHFHEVGALDAIADVVGVAAGTVALGLDSVSASPVAVGSGEVRSEHGLLPVPAPAVVELLRQVPSYGGGAGVELATPTGAALVTTVAAGWGDQPAMTVSRQAVGAGGRDRTERPNVVRLLVGEPVPTSTAPEVDIVLEANVDDMDPRLWPAVLTRLLDAGASDAWLVPILMKKGRPAHTLCVLASAESSDAIRRLIFTETTTIGIRATSVQKTPLRREESVVDVDGQAVRIKSAALDGTVVNAQPEYDDVVAAAAVLGRPVKAVLADAIAAARSPRPAR